MNKLTPQDLFDRYHSTGTPIAEACSENEMQMVVESIYHSLSDGGIFSESEKYNLIERFLLG